MSLKMCIVNRINGLIFAAVVVFGAFSIDGQAEKAKEKPECPVISVMGPAGISEPGDVMTFLVTVEPDVYANLTFFWTVDKGRVNVGQSTKKIGVRYLMEMWGSLAATVEISGLPDHCPKSASASSGFIIEPSPVLLSQYSIPLGSIHTRNLKAATRKRRDHPNNQIYIVEYFPAGVSEKAMRRKKSRIMAYMVDFLKVYGPSVTIVTFEADRLLTKIYLIPPGVSDPTP